MENKWSVYWRSSNSEFKRDDFVEEASARELAAWLRSMSIVSKVIRIG